MIPSSNASGASETFIKGIVRTDSALHVLDTLLEQRAACINDVFRFCLSATSDHSQVTQLFGREQNAHLCAMLYPGHVEYLC
jgi:hypothetical protein